MKRPKSYEIVMKFALSQWEPFTYEDICNHIGLNHSYIRQIMDTRLNSDIASRYVKTANSVKRIFFPTSWSNHDINCWVEEHQWLEEMSNKSVSSWDDVDVETIWNILTGDDENLAFAVAKHIIINKLTVSEKINNGN